MDLDETLGGLDELKSIHRSEGIVPLLHQDDPSTLNIEAAKMHQSRIDELQKYLTLVEEAQDINEITGQKIIAQLSYGYRKSGEYAALAKFAWKEAKADRKRAEAIAFIDNFVDYAAEKKKYGADLKMTEKTRDHYVNIDQDVREASRKESLYEAMCEQLQTIKMEFLMAISTAKAIAYGYKDSNALSGSSLSVNEKE